MSQEFDLQAFQKEVEKELRTLIAARSAERSDVYALSKTLQRLLENASDRQSDQDLLRRLLEMEPGQQALRQDEAKKYAIDFSQRSEHTSLQPVGRRAHISEQAAKAILHRKGILVYLCPALESTGNDAFEIAKVITPILSGLVIAGTISIPLVPVLFASMALVISRSGVASLCAEYGKKDEDKRRRMKILAIEREVPGVTEEQCKPYLKAEAAKAWELYQAGVVRELYFRQDVSAAVLILECADVDEANRVLNTLPLVQAGLIAFDVIPLVPYPGFSRLFTD